MAELSEMRQTLAKLGGSETRSKQAATALHGYTKEWHKTFDAITDIVALISPDLEFIEANKSCCDSLGMKPEELIGRKCYEVVHGLDGPIFNCPCNATLKTGKPHTNEISQHGRYYIATADPIYDEDGELVAFVHTIKDITGRKQAEEALKKAHDDLEKRVNQRTHELLESNMLLQREIAERKRTEETLWNTNELLETIFSTTHLLMAYLDNDFNFIRVNNAYAAANEHTPEFFIGQNYLYLYPCEDDEYIFRNVIDKGEPYSAYGRPFEFAKYRESDVRYWDWSIYPVKDSSRVVKGLILLFLDVTERKLIDERLQWSQRMESVGRLAAGVAHEIGNPLNSISSLAQLLQMKSRDASVRDNLHLMATHITRISKTVKNMVDFAHPASGEKKSTRINGMLNAALEISKYDKRARNIEVELDLAPNMQPVLVVGDQLLQVFTNIIFNAFDAMPDGGKLTIKTRQESERIDISFTDTGTGIKEDFMGNIFDPFFTTKDVGQGTGLGLSISYGIVRSFDGEISVQSVYGSGSTFTVTLPIKHIVGKRHA